MILIALIGMAFLLMFQLRTFDHIVKYEHDHVKDAWNCDGRPLGFFWSSPESDFIKGSVARFRLSLTWICATPQWAKSVPEVLQNIKRLRVMTLLWTCVMVIIATRVWR
jgi:arginine exporter protein ArgO